MVLLLMMILMIMMIMMMTHGGTHAKCVNNIKKNPDLFPSHTMGTINMQIKPTRLKLINTFCLFKNVLFNNFSFIVHMGVSLDTFFYLHIMYKQ